jgi:hypothetical protein
MPTPKAMGRSALRCDVISFVQKQANLVRYFVVLQAERTDIIRAEASRFGALFGGSTS